MGEIKEYGSGHNQLDLIEDVLIRIEELLKELLEQVKIGQGR